MIMNIPFFRKPSVKFYSEYPEITDSYPIIHAREYKRKWVKDCATAFAKYRKRVDSRATILTATKCPGMRNVMEEGYIITTWTDFTIETSDGKMEVYYPTGMDKFLESISFEQRVVTSFDTAMSPMRIPTGRNFSHIIKVFVPYSFDIPSGYELKIMPVHYDDNPVFTACEGTTEGFHVDFNVHLFWHEKNGRVTVPAGTPLCQIVARKKQTIDIVESKMTADIEKKTKTRRLKKFNKFIW
jgi:hypothetical protein